MKILWFSVTPSMYAAYNNGHNGGGWISSLERLVRTVPEIDLGIAFEYPACCFKENYEGVSYYPINIWNSLNRKCIKYFSLVKAEEKYLIPRCLKIIEDFKPDIIHVFGSENCYGLLTKYTDIPIIIHMQGSLPSYYNARFPITVNFKDLLFSKSLSLSKKIFEFRNLHTFREQAEREKKILKHTKFFFGRTHWDRSITRVYNPNSQYFYCSEVLRDSFYVGKKWSVKKRKEIVIVSTISTPLYKGLDVVLKTAKILKNECRFNFVWKVIGVNDARFIESQYGILANEVSVELLGCIPEKRVEAELRNADFYVHPSYIDNSPNSVCEAQILGVPVICCNVGGLSSLVDDGKTGFLVPANDPIKIVDIIIENFMDVSKLSMISQQEIQEAEKRHFKLKILSDLLNGYRAILKM